MKKSTLVAIAIAIAFVLLSSTAFADCLAANSLASYVFDDAPELTYVYKITTYDDEYSAESLIVYAEDATVAAVFERIRFEEWYVVYDGHLRETTLRHLNQIWIDNMEVAD